MAFTIRNATTANDPQAAPDKVDFDILVQGLAGEGVLSGCAVTAQGTPNNTVAVAAGVVRIAGQSVTVAAGNVTMVTADATQPRFDLITVNGSGVKAWTAGTANANPVFPSVPGSSVALAAIYVPATDTTMGATQIEDKRAILLAIPDESYQDHGNAGTTETITYSTARTHRLVLDSSACALTFTGWPLSGLLGELRLLVIHDNTSNSRTITWPAAAKFPNGVQPFMPTTTANAPTLLVVTTIDSGTTLFVNLVGNDYA